MVCEKCGLKISEESRFCIDCDALISAGQPNNNEIQDQPNQPGTLGVVRGEDGVLRWIYEMNMWKNPTLVITIWKVLLLAALVPAVLVFFLSLGDGIGFAFLTFIRIAGFVAGIVSVLMLLAYPVVALINGGKYCVVFEMDEHQIKHIQMHKQFKKSQVLSMIVVLAGMMAGNAQTTGAGLLAGSKQSSISSFEKVKEIVVHEKRHVIFVNEKLSRNQVYTNVDDFAYVRDTLISRCKKAKITYR